jgi:UDP-N-acetylglucosamine--N-acetylmuramyl-(pentapeptide) pyrophosphoryl-undecaprenol N-acetylglucosamine transferase
VSDTHAPCVVVAGGGTAGHIEPALALADAVRKLCRSAVTRSS